MVFGLTTVPAVADTLNIYIWDRYLADRVLVDFTEETGHPVREEYYDSEPVRDAVVTSGRGAGFDLILMDNAALQILAEQGLFHDLSDIAAELGSTVIDPRWQEACGAYGIPYSFGVLGLLYRESVAREPLTSWRQLFESPVEHRGRIVMYADDIDTTSAALLATGAHPYAEDTTAMRRAYALMQTQLPHLLAWDYGISYAEAHGADSRMSLTFGFNGDENGLRLATGQNDWTFVVPREGSVLWADCLAVPKGKPVTEAIRQFLLFINRPKVAAYNADDIGFASPNLPAAAHFSEIQQGRMEMLSTVDVRADARTLRDMGFNARRLRDRMMKALVSGAQP
ncbi:MAG: spermidine/putrescine ABC transporter substrate-binding protein [Halieaceae bacterium]|nr:spermidine/putrescine ABC transporter substrate-binding protein [Halieaceae bacterium]